jgi:hypothetical protein
MKDLQVSGQGAITECRFTVKAAKPKGQATAFELNACQYVD